MSHEIRTPLNGMLGMADLMDDLCDQPIQRKYLGIIQESGKGLLSIINDILDFSKIEAGKLDLENIPFKVVSLVEGQGELLAARAREKGLSLMTYIDPALNGEVMGDPGRIGQILLNLISNSIKFTSAGFISVRADLQRFQLEQEKVEIRFSVRDSGIGLSQASISKLFQPFTQADGSTARRFGGTGLGLSICRRLSEMMGGNIAVESTEGVGSEFWFTVVLHAKSLGEVARRAQSPQPKILLYETDQESRDILLRYLQNWGFSVQVALTEPELTTQLEATHEILLTDQETLGNLSHSMLDNPRFRDLTKVVLSSFEREELPDAMRERRMAIAARVTRPVRQSELFDALIGLTVPTLGSLPLIPDKARPSPIIEIAAAGAGQVKILVAEDNSVNTLIVITLLRKLGFYAEAVDNGEKAVAAYKEGGYHLVLMDCQMPEMDGYEATRRIRELEKISGTRTPIIALTANAMREDEARCLAAGMDDHVAKPLKKERLIAAIERWLLKVEYDSAG